MLTTTLFKNFGLFVEPFNSSFCYLILKKKDQDRKGYRRVQISSRKNNDNAGESVHWSLLQFYMDA